MTALEVDVGRGEIVDALVIAPVVVVRDECIDLIPLLHQSELTI